MRKSNVELLRIVSMCAIIAIHYFNPDLGGISNCSTYLSTGWLCNLVVLGLGIPLVNCFVLITGYFEVEKDSLSFSKAIRLLMITTVYGLIHYIIAEVMDMSEFSVLGIVYAAFPFLCGKRWFIETYIILILIAPFINIIIKNINKKAFQILLIIQVSIFSIWYSFGLSAPVLDDGYGIINFITLYFIGAYVKLYPIRINMIVLGLGYILCAGITCFLGLWINAFGYCFFTNIVGALCVFLLFIKLNIRNNRIINIGGKHSLDVYFFHSDINTSRLIYNNFLCNLSFTNSKFLVFNMLFSIGVIYILGCICGFFRSWIACSPIIKAISKYIDLKPYDIKNSPE